MDNTVSLGPLVIATDRLLALVAVMVFVGLISAFAPRSVAPTSNAVTVTVVSGAVAGRIGYVAGHIASFRGDPASILAFWQGGFSAVTGIFAAAIALALMLGRSAVLYRSLGAVGIAVVFWSIATQTLRNRPVTLFPKGLVAYTIDGDAVPIDGFRSKPFVVNLWATWCGPCQREMPMLIRAAAARPLVPILFVDQGEAPEAVTAFLNTNRLSSPRVLVDRSQDFGRAAGSRALPTTLFIACDGTVRHTHAGEISRAALDDGIDDILERH